MPSDSFAFWFVVSVQLLAVVSVLVARLSENSATQSGFHGLFFICLITVGVASVATIHAGDASRLFCATTLPVMAVAATIDLRAPRARSI